MTATYPNELSPARYLAAFFFVLIAILLPVLTTNFLIDPRLIHQWDTPLLQRLQHQQEKMIPWGKTYAIYKYQPQVLFIGNSRTEIGLPVDPKMFGNRRVFNGAILGGRIWHDIAMLQHARMVSKLETVIWGVDYWSFTPDEGNTEFDRDLVATDGFYGARRALLNIKRSLSFDITWDSIQLILGQTKPVCHSSLASYGQRDAACEEANLLERGGAARVVVGDIRAVKDVNPKSHQPMDAFQSELQRLCRLNIRVLLYVNPSHAIALENFYEQGNASDLELWKEELADIVDGSRTSGCDAHFFDFSGFNSVTSEPIPQVSGKTAMNNYWEGSHYRTIVGRQILARMIPLPEETVPPDFGFELNRTNVATQLARIRAERTRYRAEHSQELRLLGTWFGSGNK